MMVENDTKQLESILKRPCRLCDLETIARFKKYCFNFKFKPGKEQVIVDTLSSQSSSRIPLS